VRGAFCVLWHPKRALPLEHGNQHLYRYGSRVGPARTFTMADLAFIIVTLVVAVLNIPPLFWHLENGNSGPTSLGIWSILINLTLGVITLHTCCIGQSLTPAD
jgi:hypothetical protein